MPAQIISHHPNERLTEAECEVGQWVLAGAEVWQPECCFRRVVRHLVGRVPGFPRAPIFEEMTFEKCWTSEERAIYCWMRVK